MKQQLAKKEKWIVMLTALLVLITVFVIALLFVDIMIPTNGFIHRDAATMAVKAYQNLSTIKYL